MSVFKYMYSHCILFSFIIKHRWQTIWLSRERVKFMPQRILRATSLRFREAHVMR